MVRGPDPIWGGDIRNFHPPRRRFDGVIGGPPCQAHSKFIHLSDGKRKKDPEDLTFEFIRTIEKTEPDWFLMENVPDAPDINPIGYGSRSFILNNRELGEIQNRKRKFVFGVRHAPPLDLKICIEIKSQNSKWTRTVLASGGVRPGHESARGRLPGRFYGYQTNEVLKRDLVAQGLPSDFLKNSPFTVKGKYLLVGNGVPMPMGRELARAIRKLIYQE